MTTAILYMPEGYKTMSEGAKKNICNGCGSPVIYGAIKELLAEKVNKMVDEYIQTHIVDAERIIKQVIQEGLGVAVIRAFDAQFREVLQTFEINLKEQLNQY